MSINNVRRIILGLDHLTYGAKRRQLTFDIRFDDYCTEIKKDTLTKIFSQVSFTF